MARRRSLQSSIYRALRQYNDMRAVDHVFESGDPGYVTDRIGRRMIGRASSRLQRALFPPRRRRR
jgi:hypothetical protein